MSVGMFDGPGVEVGITEPHDKAAAGDLKLFACPLEQFAHDREVLGLHVDGPEVIPWQEDQMVFRIPVREVVGLRVPPIDLHQGLVLPPCWVAEGTLARQDELSHLEVLLQST